MTAAFSTEPVAMTRAPLVIRWTWYAVSTVNSTTPTSEMIQPSGPAPTNTLTTIATMSPKTPIRR